MKKLITIILIAIPSLLLAQKSQKIILPLDSISNSIIYQEVIQVDGATKDDLYIRAREWFAKTYRSAQDVIQMDDKQAGKIIGKGASSGYYSVMLTPMGYSLRYTVSITVKDGRYRYEISSFVIRTDPNKYSGGMDLPVEAINTTYITGKGSQAIPKKVIPHVNSTSLELIESIKQTMNNPAKGIKSKDDF